MNGFHENAAQPPPRWLGWWITNWEPSYGCDPRVSLVPRAPASAGASWEGDDQPTTQNTIFTNWPSSSSTEIIVSNNGAIGNSVMITS